LLDLRLYRLTLLPFLIGLVVVAFSLHAAPAPLASAQPAQTFDPGGAQSALSELSAFGAPVSAGSAVDDALARVLATRPPPQGLAAPGFTVRVLHSTTQTRSGTRAVETVVATRAGPAGGAGIAVVADRSATPASTAALLELAASYATLAPGASTHSLTLVSTSGGTGGVGAVASELSGLAGGAVVIGDPAGAATRGAAVVPWSAGGGIAPPALRATVEGQLRAAIGHPVADVSFADELAWLALPFAAGDQAQLEGAGVPAVLARGAAAAAEPTLGGPTPSTADLDAFGQGIVNGVAALDQGPALPSTPTRDVSLGSQVLDGWGPRLLAGLLLLSLGACTLDLLARARRRRALVARHLGWVLSFAAPFLLAGIFAIFLGATGLLPDTPAAPVTSAEIPIGGSGAAALVSLTLLFALAWVLRTLVRRRRRDPDAALPEPLGGATALLLIATLVAFLVWLVNPYTALLVIVPAHVWLVVLTRERGRTPRSGLVAMLVSIAPTAAALAIVAAGLHASPVGLAWTLVLLVAGGGLPFGGLLLASAALGCLVASATLLLASALPDPEVEITVRGPLSYAGPGSLGGTRSALRR
jgi:hypothetical protein